MNHVGEKVKVIELRHMNSRKFYMYMAMSSLCVQAMVYPVVLITTNLQVQKQRMKYRNALGAFLDIIREEKLTGLYRGFYVSLMTIPTGLVYITTYEHCRHSLYSCNDFTKSFVSGGTASLISNTLRVPIDVVIQHIMLKGDHKYKSEIENVAVGRLKEVNALTVTAALWQSSGPRALYKGYIATIVSALPNSALWWVFYHLYSDQLSRTYPFYHIPKVLLYTMVGPLATMTAISITNPLDIVRVRMQVSGEGTFLGTLKKLFQEEGWKGYHKGLSARMLGSCISSSFIAVAYESCKRFSLKPEYIHDIRW